MQYVDDFFLVCCVIVYGVVECFFQCICDDVYVFYDVVVFWNVVFGFFDEFGRVIFVCYNECVVFVGEVVDFIYLGNVIVYGEYIVGYNDVKMLCLCSFELGFEVGYIIVFVVVLLCFIQFYFINDGSVIQFIGNNCIFFFEKWFEYIVVGIKSCCIENGIFCFIEFCDFLFQFFVNILGIVDEMYGRYFVIMGVECIFCCLYYIWM